MKQYNENELKKEISIRWLADKNVLTNEKLYIKWLYFLDVLNESN